MDQKMFLVFIFLFPLLSTAQTEDKQKESLPAYIKIGIGSGFSSFRDRATSPLFYSGVPLTGSVGRLRTNDQKETNFDFRLTLGRYGAEVDEKEAGFSSFNSLSLEYSRLYGIAGWSDQNWNYKAGGNLVTTANIRSNERLQNNSFGFEGFLNLMGSFKVSRDVSRKVEKQKKLWFIRYTLKPRKRILSYQLNLGIWNNVLRNGYAYIDQAGILNQDPFIWEDYVFKTFSGLRFSSELNYTLFLTGARNNAVQISYLWDAIQTEAGPDAFAMALHTIRFSLLYNTK